MYSHCTGHQLLFYISMKMSSEKQRDLQLGKNITQLHIQNSSMVEKLLEKGKSHQHLVCTYFQLKQL